MLINLIQDTTGSNSSAPAYFMQDMQIAANMLDALITSNITVNLRVGWGSYNNTVDNSLTGSGGAYAAGSDGQLVSLSTVDSWLVSSEHGAIQTQAYSTLAGLSLSGSTQIYVDSAEEKALGHYTGSSSTIDGAAAFGTGIASSSLVGVALHELSHALGRNTNYYAGHDTIMDLFRYGSAGHLQETGGQAAYLSINGGTTDLADFGVSSDYGDLLNSSSRETNDAFNEFYTGSTTQSLTALDKEILNILGFNETVGGGGNATSEPNNLLWNNFSSGGIGEWTFSQNNPSWTLLGNTNGWSAVGRGDYNGAGTSDILFYNAQTNGIGDWTGNLTNNPTWTLLGNTNGWSVVGSGDYNGDGTNDILFYNAQTNGIGDWTMKNNSPSWTLLGNTNGWSVVGSGDYNGDGTSDILFYNAQTNGIGDWTMNNNNPSWTLLGNTNGWSVVGSGDYNGDGTSDILFYNAQTNGIGDWTMKNNSPSWTLLGNTNGWTVVGSGDYNGDGTDDIMFFNYGTQQVGDWTMQNNTPTWHLLGNSNGWTVTGGQT